MGWHGFMQNFLRGGLIFFALVAPCLAIALETPVNQIPVKQTPVKQTVIIAHDGTVGENHDGFVYRELLELALRETLVSHGPYEVRLIPVIANENRLLRAIEQGTVDLAWMPFDKNISRALHPVKVSLLKELSNYRLFIIRADDQWRFSEVKSLDDLRRLRGGMGTHWPDRRVMEANDLPISLSVSYQNLFKMLAAGRFDYFSRGIHQVAPEAKEFARLGLALESDLMLQYDNPVYFYVHRDNTALAERLEQGLKLAMANGSYGELIRSIPRLLWAQEELAQQRRLILELKNP
jgi:hypothetical protein